VAAYTGFEPAIACKGGGSMPLELEEIRLCFNLTNNYISCQERDLGCVSPLVYSISLPGRIYTAVGHLIFSPVKEVFHFTRNTLFSPYSARVSFPLFPNNQLKCSSKGNLVSSLKLYHTMGYYMMFNFYKKLL